MKPVARHEIVDHATYEDGREAFRRQVFAAKEPRRVHLGEHLTLLFENPLTVRYQVQEMMRAERIVRDADIQHELDTYNELIPGRNELSGTLFVEIDNKERLYEWLPKLVGIQRAVSIWLHDGSSVPSMS